MTLTVIKRDGRREPLNLDKFHRVTMWACEGLSTVSASEIEMRLKDISVLIRSVGKLLVK